MTTRSEIVYHDPARAPAAERLIADTRGEQHARRLRLAAAALALLSGTWLLLVGETWLLRALAIAALLFAVAWTTQQSRRSRTPSDSSPDYLELGDDTLLWTQGTHIERAAWSEITAVELDDDRLVVVLRMRDGTIRRIEPRYRDLGLRGLAERLQAAWQRACARPSAPPTGRAS